MASKIRSWTRQGEAFWRGQHEAWKRSEKDAPVSRAVKLAGTILCRPVLGGLHHQYVRI